MQKHRVRSGEQTVAVTVLRKPARAGIDPHHLLIDLEMGDNIEEVESESRGRNATSPSDVGWQSCCPAQPFADRDGYLAFIGRAEENFREALAEQQRRP